MIKRSFLASILTLFCFSDLSAQQIKLSFKNNLSIDRKDELVNISRSDLEKKGDKFSPSELLKGVINGKPVALQFLDLDGNGAWEEIVFLHDFKAMESLTLLLNKTTKIDKAIDRAHVRQRRAISQTAFGPVILKDSVPANQPNTDFAKNKMPPFLTEGPAWENDKIGFRIYMDIRNTKDIWGKTTDKMMMDTIGANPAVSYHKQESWGMDLLAVGKSLGAGSLALNVPRSGKQDTLVRLGGKNMGRIAYQSVADGPILAIFKLTYPEWDVLGDGKLTSLTEEIWIWGGQYFTKSNVTVRNAPTGATLVTGIVNLKSSAVAVNKNASVTTLSTFDVQSENKDKLGMALIIESKSLIKNGQTSNTTGDIRNTYTAELRLNNNKPTSFRFYVGWEMTNPIFQSPEGFTAFLKTEAVKLSNPIAKTNK